MMSDSDKRLMFKDFLPKCEKLKTNESKEEGATQKVDFKTLLDHANEWLSIHPDIEIKTCETVKFRTEDAEILPEKMVCTLSGQITSKWCIRGLRLWYKQCARKEEKVKQIGYVDLVPEKKGCSSTTYETLGELINRYNENILNVPIPGRIITIETECFKGDKKDRIDPLCTYQKEKSSTDRFIFILRIYYEVTDPMYEEIGCWGLEIDSRKMTYTLDMNGTFYIRFLRVSHLKLQSDKTAKLQSKTPLSRKIFAPLQLSFQRTFIFCNSEPEFQNIHEIVQRITTWLKSTGAEVLSVETTTVPTVPRLNSEENIDESSFYIARSVDYIWVSVLNVYLCGDFKEVSKENVPPVADTQNYNCNII